MRSNPNFGGHTVTGISSVFSAPSYFYSVGSHGLQSAQGATQSEVFSASSAKSAASQSGGGRGVVSGGASALIAQIIAQSSGTSSATDDLASQFDSWVKSKSANGAREDYIQSLDANRSTFLAVAQRARQTGGMDNPQAFISSLNSNEFAALQAVNGVAQPIDASSLGKEGGYNLLQAPGQTEDLNQDGTIEVGGSSLIVFPPQDAPQAVTDAWNKATAGLDGSSKGIMELTAWTSANGLLHAGRSIAPDETPGFNWKSFAQSLVAGAEEDQKYQVSPEQKALAQLMTDRLKEFLVDLGA